MKKIVNSLLVFLLLLFPFNLKANTVLSRGERLTSLDTIKHKSVDAIVLGDEQVTITFDDGVSQIVEIVSPNSFLTTPENPNKAGYTFKGWYTAKSGGKLWDFAVDVMPNNNLILYAQYTINWYALVYVDDFGKYETSLSIMYGTLLPNQIKPVRKDLVFLGWYDAPNGGNLWDFAVDRMPSHDLKLYAQYATAEYTLTYNDDGFLSTALVGENTLLAKPMNPTKEGRTFLGWYTEMLGGVEWDFAVDRMPSGNLMLYARYTPNLYNVSYINDNGDAVITNTVTFGTLLPEPLNPIKEGHTFKGWYTSEVGGIMWDFTTDKMPAHNLVLYAQYTTNSYLVTFDNEGIQNGQMVPFNQLLTIPEVPTKNGYSFLGWYTSVNGGIKWNFTTDKMPAHELNLYARYTINTYSVSYYDEGLITTDLIEYNSLLIEPNLPPKEASTFLGWYTSVNGGTKWNFATDKMPAHELNLYAQYTSDLYVVTYDNEGYRTQQTIKKGALLNEPAVPQKAGYTFKGWYTAKIGGKRWDFTTDLMPAQNMILYAQYIAENQTITFDVAGGDIESKPTDIIQPTNSLVDISGVANPTRKNYQFLGWYNGEAQIFGVINMPVGGMVLVARWEEMFKNTTPYIEAKNIEMNLSEVNDYIKQGNIHAEVLLRSEVVIRNSDSNIDYNFLYVELEGLTNGANKENNILISNFSQMRAIDFIPEILLTNKPFKKD